MENPLLIVKLSLKLPEFSHCFSKTSIIDYMTGELNVLLDNPTVYTT